MQISNKTLLALLVAAVALVSTAVWLTLRPPKVNTAPKVTPDQLVQQNVLASPPTVTRQEGSGWVPEGPVTVNAESGLIAKLDCDGLRKERAVTEGAARFETIPTAGCHLSLLEATPDDGTAKPQASTPFYPLLPGDEVTCIVEQSAASSTTRCNDSLAEAHAATLVVTSGASGTVLIDGQVVGPVPVEGHRLPVGVHTVSFEGERGKKEHPLTVKADEFVTIEFMMPLRDSPAPAEPPLQTDPPAPTETD